MFYFTKNICNTVSASIRSFSEHLNDCACFCLGSNTQAAAFDPLDPNPEDNPRQRRRRNERGRPSSSVVGKAYMSPGDVLRHNAEHGLSGVDTIAILNFPVQQ